ncbi:uncharacterized protein LOC123530010 [Mercenaria mercenaria]|uniref:uncharacterized protein LOC123530010 n=1 Tax=Mercenaria mercenaria TaxID=6596 RepID=UPI00234F78C4|nr:uncharacterized protein LOC123530010 [Mercenaria mercenaria]
MARSPRLTSFLDSSGSFVEERSRTFVVPSRRTESADGASEGDFASGHDMETLVSLVNNKFEKRERLIKKDMREEIERRLERDKRHHEEIIATLRRDLSQLTKISQECDGLKDLQKAMQQEMNSQQEKIMSLREENAHLRMENAKLQGVHSEVEALKIENDSIRREKVNLEMRSIKLKSTIAEKEQEIISLKTLIDTQYKRIKLDLTNTRDRFHSDQETIHTGMKQQNLVLAEISAAVQTISTGMGGRNGAKRDLRRSTGGNSTSPKTKAFVAGGKVSSETTLSTLPGHTPKKRH